MRGCKLCGFREGGCWLCRGAISEDEGYISKRVLPLLLLAAILGSLFFIDTIRGKPLIRCVTYKEHSTCFMEDGSK